MGVGEEASILSLIYEYLSSKDIALGKIFQEKTKAVPLPKGYPTLPEVFHHYNKTCANKLNIPAKSDIVSSSYSAASKQETTIAKKLQVGKCYSIDKALSSNKTSSSDSKDSSDEEPHPLRKEDNISKHLESSPNEKYPSKRKKSTTIANENCLLSKLPNKKIKNEKEKCYRPEKLFRKAPHKKSSSSSGSSSDSSEDEKSQQPNNKGTTNTLSNKKPGNLSLPSKLNQLQQKKEVCSSSSGDSDSSEGKKVVHNNCVINANLKEQNILPKTTVKTPVQKKSSSSSEDSDDSSDDEKPQQPNNKAIPNTLNTKKPGALSIPSKSNQLQQKKQVSSSSSDDSDSSEGKKVVNNKAVEKINLKQQNILPKTIVKTPVQKKSSSSSEDSDDSSENVEPCKKMQHLASTKGNILIPTNGKNETLKHSSYNEKDGRENDIKGTLSIRQKRKIENDEDEPPKRASFQLESENQEIHNSSHQPNHKVKQRKSVPFRRVKVEEVELDSRLCDNSFEAKRGARGSWGERANFDFKNTRGKAFRQQKTKKKRGSYKGGQISTTVNSIKF